MTEQDNKYDSGNKIEEGYQLLGKKWVGLIVHNLMIEPKRFSQLHVSIPALSKRMLNERIKELEDYGIVSRNVVNERPIYVEYSLTDKGLDLAVALLKVESWAERWL